ncbi:MAG: hypothetical protein M1825_002263 [Sarcosagium campestre]|nr:MAG: hypothetical protein M1825_002263 [Sarcosagium campestre]
MTTLVMMDEGEGSITDLVLAPLRAAISKPARRAYLSTILIAVAGFALLGLSIVAYILFYLNYIPRIGLDQVVHLQFGNGSHPHGFASLPPSALVSDQSYDMTLSLLLPRSPPNLAAGNIMLEASLLGPGTQRVDVLAHSRRPTMLTYASPLVDTAHRAVNLPLYLVGWKREEERLHVAMMEDVRFARGAVPGTVKVEVQASSDDRLMVYAIAISFQARFRGLRWLMYNHRIISLAVFTSLFYLTSAVSTLAAWFLIGTLLPTQASTTTTTTTTTAVADTAAVRVKRETESPPTSAPSSPALSPTPRTFPSVSSRKAGPLRYLPTPRATPGPEGAGEVASGDLPVGSLGVEADDEREGGAEDYDVADLEDEEEERGWFGFGAEARRMDSGIGTSMDEGRPAVGLQRRRRSSATGK